ncbi:MAG: hypothetical protein WDO73_14740 [Ignavibacteriota bacterium]
MSKNLLKAGHSLVVFDVVPGPLAEVVEAGRCTRRICGGHRIAIGSDRHDAAGRPAGGGRSA